MRLGPSAEVIGAELGMSANAVRVAQHRAAAKLRQLIEASEDQQDLFETFGEAQRARPAA